MIISSSIYTFFNDFQGSIVAIVTVALTYPFLRKKLLENHISSALETIQEANRLVMKKATSLIDELLPHSYNIDPISKEEIEYLYSKVSELEKLSLDGSSEGTTILFFLKSTLRNTLRHYNPKDHGLITNREILNLVISLLEDVTFYASQVVQVPKSTKTIKNDIINDKIKKYVRHSKFEKYKYFKKGILFESDSAYTLLFYDKIIGTSTPLIMRSGFQIFNSVVPVSRFLILSEFYAPLTLKIDDTALLSNDSMEIFLMGFKIKTSIGSVKNKTIELYYTNPQDNYSFLSCLSQNQFIKKSRDSYIPNSTFDLRRLRKYRVLKNEIIRIEFNLSYTKNQFELNKKAFFKRIKEN